MKKAVNRREFLAASAAAGLGLAAARRLGAGEFKTTLKKALICGKPTEKNLAKLKAAGFDGVETQAADVSTADAENCRKIAEKVGMKIHSVLRGWMQFNSTDAAKVEATIAKTETALRAAQGYGAGAILLVPCRIGGMTMPKAWEFDIELDEKNGHLKRVVKGDNTPYADYIKAHDHATDTTIEAVKKLIPVAEKTGVVIAIENVWNNLWVKPAVFAHLVKLCGSKWLQAYFDIGNHVKYAPPEQFIRALGPAIAKCHVKDFKLNPDGHGGKFIAIRDGSVNWPVVRGALDKAGYNGWMTIEGSGGLSLEEKSKRLDLILAGK